jgi:hypothetical protein
MMVAWLGGAGTARGDDGVCVRVDPYRDSLDPDEQRAVRIAIEVALEKEGVALARPAAAGPPGVEASCARPLVFHAIRLGEGVTVTIIAADGEKRTGRADNLGEVDLLVSQLVRSLVTGRSLATGSGVTDRANVLRAQAAPRRASPSSRRWDPVIAIGGGVLQLPATDDRARQRQWNIVSLESRWWGFTDGNNAFELYGRVLLHDYAVIGASYDAYQDSKDDGPGAESGRLSSMVFSPLAVANYEGGLGFVSFAGATPPRPYLRLGFSVALLCRFSDPEHYFDLGFGGYGGVGVQLTRHLGVSVAANVSNPFFHNFMDRGYDYFGTATVMLEYVGEGKGRRLPAPIGDTEPPVIRRIND